MLPSLNMLVVRREPLSSSSPVSNTASMPPSMSLTTPNSTMFHIMLARSVAFCCPPANQLSNRTPSPGEITRPSRPNSPALTQSAPVIRPVCRTTSSHTCPMMFVAMSTCSSSTYVLPSSAARSASVMLPTACSTRRLSSSPLRTPTMPYAAIRLTAQPRSASMPSANLIGVEKEWSNTEAEKSQKALVAAIWMPARRSSALCTRST